MIKENQRLLKENDTTKLFEKFTRISNSLTHNMSGSGLGRYWVNKIVKMHNGHIDIESVPAQGTTFHIFIPYEVTNG